MICSFSRYGNMNVRACECAHEIMNDGKRAGRTANNNRTKNDTANKMWNRQLFIKLWKLKVYFDHLTEARVYAHKFIRERENINSSNSPNRARARWIIIH